MCDSIELPYNNFNIPVSVTLNMHTFNTNFWFYFQISSHPIVVDFFEPRPTDPVPYRTSPDGDSMDEDDAFSEDVFSRKWIGKEAPKCNI